MKAEDNRFPYVTLDEQSSDPPAPPADNQLVYAKTGGVYVRNSAGAIIGPIGAAPTTLPPSGPAGGDLGGTYPNPTVLDDSHAHTSATLPAAPPPSGAAGGDLGGTYPNPIVLDDSHNHTSATAPGGASLGSAVPLIESGSGAAGTSPLGSHQDHVHPAASGGGATGAAGGDLSGTYPNPQVLDDSHNHTAATAPGVGGGMTNPMTTPGDLIYMPALPNRATPAQGATASASAEWGAPYPSSNIIDGNNTTFAHLTDSGSGNWYKVDLGTPRAIGSWQCVISSSPNEIPSSWILQSSPDNSTWTTQDTVAGGIGGDRGVRTITPVTFRYWRMLQSGSVGWDASIATFALYGTVAPDRLPYVADGQVLTGVGGVPTWATPGGANIQSFRTPGSFTWTKPASGTVTRVFLMGGGGGGGSGRKGATNSNRFGGGGGAGPGYTEVILNTALLPSTLPVVVGAGGAGGASITASDTDGAAGTVGGDSSIGSPFLGWAGGGGAGAGGTNSAASGGTAGQGVIASGGGGGAGGSGLGSSAPLGAGHTSGGGGGGGAVTAAGVGGNGGQLRRQAVGNAGGAVGANGTSEVPPAGVTGGAGGGGGGGSISGNAGSGGNGSLGSGGGGGGAAENGVGNSGAGGKGGDGWVVVITT